MQKVATIATGSSPQSSLQHTNNQLYEDISRKIKSTPVPLQTIKHIPKGDLQGLDQDYQNGENEDILNLDLTNLIKQQSNNNKENVKGSSQEPKSDCEIQQSILDQGKKGTLCLIINQSNGVMSNRHVDENMQFKERIDELDNNLGFNESLKVTDLRLQDNKYSIKQFNTSASIIGEDYFNQDKDSKIVEQFNRAKADITQFKSYFVKFRWGQFFEFSFYHILFYIIFGPFSSLIIRFFGKSLPNNLIFTMISMSLFYQTLFFIFTFSTYTLYYLTDCPNIYFQSEVMMEIAVIISRCMVIAFKYATYDPVKIQVIRNHHLTYDEIFSDFYLVDWAAQSDRIIHDETYFGLRAFDIDPSMFYLDFMKEPDILTLKNAEQYTKDLEKWHKSKSQQFKPENVNITKKGEKSIFGYAVMKEFSKKFQESNQFIYKYVYYFCQGYGIYKAILPIAFRLIEGKYPQNYNWQEFIIMFGVAWNTRQIYFYCIMQLMNGFLDVKRKVFQQNQLAFMIAPRKLRNLDCFKVYPTINIFKASTLKGWQLIRQVCFEYGKSYFLRVQALFSTFFIVMLTMLTFLGLGIFKVVELERCFIVIIVSDTVLFFSLILMLCYYCAKANQMFQTHENILKGNKSIISDIYRNRHKYFSKEGKSSNYIYNKGIEKIIEEAEYTTNKDPVSYTLELIRDYEDQIQDLQFDDHNNPVTLLGVKITFGLIQSVVVTLAGVAITLVANFLKEFTKK